jgi:peptide deformylase
MALLPIYLFGSDMLRLKAKPVKELDNETIKLVYDLFETMYKSNGIGLAATQVGSMRRVIVVDVTPAEEDLEGGEKESLSADSNQPKKLVLINPEVLDRSGSWTMEEGCLSIPDVRADVDRPETVRIRFCNANFEESELEVSGLLGRVILHEIDHLDGILFIDHLSSAKRALLRSKLKKIKKGEVDTSYPIVSAPVPRRSGRVEA